MKFCFFGNISGALKNRTSGGAELQVALLAKALARKGHDVVIIDPYSNSDFVTEEGVKLFSIPEWNKGIKGIRLFSHRIPTLKKMLLQQDADFYYARMRTYFHLLSYKTARNLKKRFILAIAAEVDILSLRKKFIHKYKFSFDLSRFITYYLPSDIVFNYLLKKADYITIQHSGQQIDPNKINGKIILFPNIFDLNSIQAPEAPSNDYIVYVGDISISKGSINFYQLVKILDKKIPVVVVGTPIDKRSKKIYKKLSAFKNVILKGRLAHKETITQIANAKALINTSDFEGFPNIFLEAWAMGVPVASLKVDPGNVFKKYNLGICCNGDLNKMKSWIELNEADLIKKEALKSYVSEFHNFDFAADKFVNLLTAK